MIVNFLSMLPIMPDIDSAQVCASIDEAVSVLASIEQSPDVIFLNLDMPKGNGVEFLKLRNASPYIRDITVVILTTKAGQDVVDITSGLEVPYVVTKSTRIDILVSQIQQSLYLIFSH